MYLKALEIQGFKSFPDRTRLTFDGEITAIVGPNGSGKSNISDAIRWVMGEMSTKALRGTKMEDVIFGGTAKRQPLGFAEVSLVLDNTEGSFAVDSSEVMVTRRFYRSGESEYYINRASVRLKDIVEMFMDTGLGKEGYSNIGQGRIDEILSVRSQDRREIFEEAAGISRYRHRKEETERKLASTEDNLTRVNDKISELELQVEPLRRQAEQAKKYLIYRDELRGLEITVWLDSLARLAEGTKKTAEDFASNAFILKQEHENLDQLYLKIEELNRILHDWDETHETMRTQISTLEAEASGCAGEIAVMRTQVSANSDNIERIRRELSDAQGRTETLGSRIREHETRMEEITQEVAGLQEKLQNMLLEGRSLTDSSDENGRKLLDLRGKQASALLEASEKKAERSGLEASLQAYAERTRTIRTTRKEAEAKHAESEKDLAACRKRREQAEEEVQSAQNTIDGYRMRQDARIQARDRAQKKVGEIGVEQKTTDSKIAMLEEMEREYEGFTKSVRNVLQDSRRGVLRGIHGPVSSLLETENSYAVAIETALGGALQNIVVETAADGKAAIRHLQRQNAGRATFLPLDTIRPQHLDEKNLNRFAGFVGIASELIRCRETYRNIMNNLLGRIVVAEDLDAAVEIGKACGHRFRIVTLDGQVVNPGGSLTGGSVTKNAGMLSRANELRALRERAAELERQRVEAETAYTEAARQAAEVEYSITEAEGRKRRAEDELLRQQSVEGQYRALLEAAAAAMESADAEWEALREKTAAAQQRTTELDKELAALSTQSDAAEAEITRLSANQDSMTERNNAISETINALRLQTATLETERQNAQTSVEQLRTLESEMSGDQRQKHELIAGFTAENQRLEAEIAQKETAQAEIAGNTERAREQYAEALKSRALDEAKKTRMEKETKEKNGTVILLEQESARLEQKKQAAEMEEKQIIDKLWENYELTPTTAKDAVQPVESISEANKRISTLKRSISALGTPNIGAIEEFDRVNERYTMLTGQRDDITKAKRDLEGIIDGLTTEMTKVFRTEFDRINDSFRTTFEEIFRGGKAHLELEDENNVLSCGIEIKAQPPGKQLKSITLLSGGEKALVAIALYFAILKVRPTPFCMLDEIDAALDDNNVSMYAQYLRGLSDHTQFIVITHRRGTMEEADVLYGVTMQEQGVSKMLSIDLNQMTQQLGIKE